MVFKPATPGFVTTFVATILLLVVSFSVPYFKSIYFLQATYNDGGNSGLINFGTLGYCLVVNGATTCTKPSIGYEFNPNELLGDNIHLLQIPTIVTKWITYALFLHVIAFALAAVSAIFGLLAHIREFSMVCFSSCISGLAASLALLAFIFDLVLFYLARARIRSIPGSTATIGEAVWLTLAAWVLLFISGCMFGIGRCCIGSRPRDPRAPKKDQAGYGGAYGAPQVNSSYAEQMRMDAIQAEIDRKARQKADSASGRKESQLPRFEEHETTPLSAGEEDDPPYSDGSGRFGAAGAATGYTPPPARRQASAGSSVSQGTSASGYPPHRHASGGRSPPMPVPVPAIGYPPSQPSQQSVGAYSQRQPSLRERDIYENAGLAAGGASQNNYLRPQQPTTHGRGDTYHTQTSSYHSAQSHLPYPSEYGQQQYDHYGQDAGGQAYGQSGYNNYNNQPDYTHQRQQATFGQSYSDPYASSYPQASASDPYYNNGRQPSVHSQYSSHTNTPPPPTNSGFSAYGANQGSYPSPTSSQPQRQYSTSPGTGYPPQPRSAGSGQDLNFPGVPAVQPQGQHQYQSQSSYPPQPHVDTQMAYGIYTSGSPYASPVSAGASSRTPANYQSPPAVGARLPGLREELEPSTAGRSAVNPAAGSAVPEDAPPGYEDPNGSRSGYRNEKATYRPS